MRVHLTDEQGATVLDYEDTDFEEIVTIDDDGRRHVWITRVDPVEVS